MIREGLQSYQTRFEGVGMGMELPPLATVVTPALELTVETDLARDDPWLLIQVLHVTIKYIWRDVAVSEHNTWPCSSYETANEINVEEKGYLKNAGNPETEAQVAEGSFSYTGTDGVRYTVTYVADENGFVPVGDHLPTPPPIPEAILKALAYIEAHPEENEAGGPTGRRRWGWTWSRLVVNRNCNLDNQN